MSNLKLPPQNIEAEESVLGALMLDKNSVLKVVDLLKGNDFYKPVHGKIFESMVRLYEKGQPIDILTVKAKLDEEGALQDVGGTVYLTKLIESVPSAANVEHYANIVKEKRVLRDLIETSANISEQAFGASDGIEQTLDDIEQKIFAIANKFNTKKFVAIKDELHSAYERIEKVHRGDGGMRGVTTGFTGLDNILSGLQKSDLIVLGARPSMGKTSLALDIARHVALKEKKGVAIFSLEMSKDQVIDRLIGAEAQVSVWQLRTGRLKNETDFQMIQHALDTLSQAQIFIDDTSSPTVLQMRAMARRLGAETDLGLIVVDYLQLIQARTNSDNLVHQVTEISRGLKGMARDLNVPVLALSQLSRSVDQRDVKIPRLADLRESGSIEQDSDVVMFIYRKDKDKASSGSAVLPEEENMAEINVAKHRNGPLGTARVHFDSDKVSFRNIDTTHSSAPIIPKNDSGTH